MYRFISFPKKFDVPAPSFWKQSCKNSTYFSLCNKRPLLTNIRFPFRKVLPGPKDPVPIRFVHSLSKTVAAASPLLLTDAVLRISPNQQVPVPSSICASFKALWATAMCVPREPTRKVTVLCKEITVKYQPLSLHRPTTPQNKNQQTSDSPLFSSGFFLPVPLSGFASPSRFPGSPKQVSNKVLSAFH